MQTVNLENNNKKVVPQQYKTINRKSTVGGGSWVKNLASENDSVLISSAAKLMDKYNSLTHIGGQKIEQLKAANNVLNLMWNIPYRFTSPNTFMNYLMFHSAGTNWSNLFAEVYNEIGAEGDFFDNDAFHKNTNAFEILSCLGGGAGWSINQLYSREDIKGALSAAGIEPGWVEINNGYETHKFWYAECGTIQDEYLSNNSREYMNTWDFRNYGFQEGDQVMVNFENYTVGADGRINVPEGVPVIMGTTFWFPGQEEHFGWGQNENGEWYRNKDFSPFVSQLDPQHDANIISSREKYGPYNPMPSPTYNPNGVATAAMVNNYANQLIEAVMDANEASAESDRAAIQRMDNNDIPVAWRFQFEIFRSMRSNAAEVGKSAMGGNLKDALSNMITAYETMQTDNKDEENIPHIENALMLSANTIFLYHSQDDKSWDYLQTEDDARKQAEIFLSAYFSHVQNHDSAAAFDFAWAAVQNTMI